MFGSLTKISDQRPFEPQKHITFQVKIEQFAAVDKGERFSSFSYIPSKER